MTWINKILKIITIAALSIFVGLPIVVYILLNLPAVQHYTTSKAEVELSRLLGVTVSIEGVNPALFNKLFVEGVTITDGTGNDTILSVDRIGAGIRIGKLLTSGRIVFSFAEIIGPEIHLWRDSAEAELNIQPIIDRLSTGEKSKESSFDLAINNVVVRGGKFTYDVLSEPETTDNQIDFNHIHVSGVKADILVPQLSDKDISIQVKRLAVNEQSGIAVSNIEATIHVDDSSATIIPLIVTTKNSKLQIDRIEAHYRSLADFTRKPLQASYNMIAGNSRFTPSDIQSLLPTDYPLDPQSPIEFSLKVRAADNKVDVTDLRLTATGGGADISIPHIAASNISVKDSIAVEIPAMTIHTDPKKLHFNNPKIETICTRLSPIELTGTMALNTAANSQAHLTVTSASGKLNLTATASALNKPERLTVKVSADGDNINLGEILNNEDLGSTDFKVTANGNVYNNKPYGNAQLDISSLVFRGYDYKDISINTTAKKGDIYTLTIQSADENAMIDIHTDMSGLKSPGQHIRAKANIFRLVPETLHLTKANADKILSGRIDVNLYGADYRNLNGRIELDNFQFADSLSNGIALDHFSLLSGGNATSRYAVIHSDILDGKIEGQYNIGDVPAALYSLAAKTMPELFPDRKPETDTDCDISINMTLRENATTNTWLSFFKSPVKVLYPVTVKADFSSKEHVLTASIEAPYLMQKDKFIDNTALHISADGDSRQIVANVITTFPTKHGATNMSIDINYAEGVSDVGTHWQVESPRRYEGRLSLTGEAVRSTTGDIYADIAVNRTTAIMNDTTWIINPSEISYHANVLTINNFEISRDKQFIRIDGMASNNPLDRIVLQLQDIDLDYVFEALAIPTAMFGGTATGDFYASEIFTKTPVLYTPQLYVHDFKYNSAILGDASIQSAWNPDIQGITIKADIVSDQSRHSSVDGVIYPTRSSLDFKFDTDSINIAFLRPFMAAFTSEVKGHASGHAHLYGTFADVNLTGDIFAQDFTLKIDYTNTQYHVTDSIHITPGRIEFDNLTIKDDYGNSAKFNGYLGHNYFHNPWFEFKLSEARNLLCYDITPEINPDWYGRVFCNGTAYVKGVPGYIDLDINVSTATNSVFNFVLSDTQAANEYTFLEFRDRNAASGDLLLSIENPSSASVKRLKKYYTEARRASQLSAASRYRINLQVDATPAAEMVIVMDPVGGDRIKARGNGNIRMEYNSSDEDLKMFGSYVLSQGLYNFTLQDIIIKDFTIKPGSSISFHGNPLDATLDIQATYAVNANLSDLDDSFLQDKDLNRTNVPVHALLKVKGDIHQPDISFDLEFPTLTQDTYRKVRSIVSTDDMMNRQIIYLLALNRFYTPDYMNSTTRSNELMSVASSTISSQLSNILGQISDNWTIAPNFRSDRGDFTDMEVDVALSSHLLNNRLLFNGNLGYRDKAMNTNTFVGDFDIEYLLNKSGSVRLKAYNRYNDQNYFVKSALTTQGVGVIYKKDFDNMFDFLKLRKPKKKESEQVAPETPSATDDDSLLQFTPRNTP